MSNVERLRINHARQVYRLCCGIERALVTRGYEATVAESIAACGVSRRTFYEAFGSMRNAYERMLNAIPAMVELYRHDWPGMEDFAPEERVRSHAYAYEAVLADFPHAEPLLFVMGGFPDVEGYRTTADALSKQRREWFDGTARTSQFMQPKYLLAYADALGVTYHRIAEAAQ